ncbi:MAG: hypothetical protein KJP04_00140 [Arenicella sp.]|nr:hypothetical protein [Arenicella sp.]
MEALNLGDQLPLFPGRSSQQAVKPIVIATRQVTEHFAKPTYGMIGLIS